MERILIVDDEISICTSLTFALEDRFEVRSTVDPAEALRMVREETFHLCLLDLRIGRVSGTDLLLDLKEVQQELIVIMMTAFGSIDSSVEAIKRGAYSYLTKPLHMEGMLAVIDQALEYQRVNRQVEYLTNELAEKYTAKGIIGRTPVMQNVFSRIEKLKDQDTSVMLYGESGTGKELVARALHFAGNRKNNRFVAVNCAAIPENLLESELFGHIRGAFSGATADKTGKFPYAQGGTIFLDEIGDMPVLLQSKLLRVLQQREVTPLGGNRPIALDVRVIAATNQDLTAAVEAGTFRQDLYYRLNVATISLPPLREMRQDLPLLLEHFLQEFQPQGQPVRQISQEAIEALMAYHFPGNIRELANILESASVMAEGPRIELQDLPEDVRRASRPRVERDPGGPGAGVVIRPGMTLEEVERETIRMALQTHHGHRQRTAEALGISERGLRNKIQRLGLDSF